MSYYSMNATYLKNTMRISGLNSGFDTEALVKASMIASQNKADAYTRKISQLTWKRDATKELNTMLNTLRNDFSTITKQHQNLVSELNYKKHTVSFAKETTAVSIDATQSTFVGSGSINILQLATAASATSVQKATAPGSEGISGNDTIYSVVAKLADPTGFRINTTTNMIQFDIGGENFEFSTSTRFSDVLNTINSAGLGFSVSYSQLTDKMTVTANETGEDSFFNADILNESSFFKSFGVTVDTFKFGKDAIVEITHGANTETVTRSTNNFSIDGIKYNLNRATNGEVIEFNVNRDIEGTVELVKSYVEEYNKVIEKLYAMYNEKPNKNFPPLTDDQRLSMTADEIKQWEAEAKKGLFYRDDRLRSLLSDLRGSFYSVIGDTGKVMANIGLGTTNYYDGGKITVDETALRSALQANPDEVFRMFAQQTETAASSGSTTMDRANSGVIRRINDLLYSYVGDNEGFYIPQTENTLRNEGTKQLEHLTKMYQEENRLYAKYAAMEKALSQLNSQTSALSNLISAGL